METGHRAHEVSTLYPRRFLEQPPTAEILIDRIGLLDALFERAPEQDERLVEPTRGIGRCHQHGGKIIKRSTGGGDVLRQARVLTRRFEDFGPPRETAHFLFF
jgi:hypothetical protein